MSANDAFLQIHEDLNWFIMCPEIRVLHIATGAGERATVVQQVAIAEFHGDNRSPFLVLEDAHTETDDGWLARTDRVRAIHEGRRKSMKEEGYQLHELLTPAEYHGNPVAVFAWTLVQALEAQRAVPELAGLVVVLAPTALENPGTFGESVQSFLRVPELSKVRFITIELGDAAAEHVLRGLGETGLRSACTVDPAETYRAQARLLAAMAAAPAGASREVSMGGAGPRDRVAPPRARELEPKPPQSPEMAEAIAREIAAGAALVGGSGALLRRRITGAALAMGERRHVDALRLTSAACAQCWQQGLLKLGCILETSMGTFGLAAGQSAYAEQAFQTAASRAEHHGLPDVASQALSGLGAALVLQGKLHEGAAAYSRAGEAAERAQVPMLAIEAYRSAGQVSLQAGVEGAAVATWQRALGVAGQAGPEVAGASSAPIVARALAAVMQRHGSHAAANSLFEQADQYERAAAATTSSEPQEKPSAPSVAAGGSHAG